MTEQKVSQIKANALIEFSNMMLGAFECGFVEKNYLDLAELHRVIQNYVKDTYNIEVPNISNEWGDEFYQSCINHDLRQKKTKN